MNQHVRLAIFASGSGTNADEIMKRFKDHPFIEVVLLLSNNPDAYALVRAKKYNVPSKIFTRQQWKDTTEVLDWLTKKQVTHIVLAGFLWLVPPYLIKAFPDRIINIHPALLPKHGGKGMYGMKVHEAVKMSRDLETGITIHLVNENYDDGKVLFQASCSVNPDDWAEKIANQVHALEYEHYPRVIEEWVTKSK